MIFQNTFRGCMSIIVGGMLYNAEQVRLGDLLE